MLSSTKYFHDRLVLLLLSANTFLALLGVLSVLLRLPGEGEGFIVQYRAQLGISAFKTGSISHILAFAAFAVVVLAIHAMLSWRAYRIKRELSLLVLALGTLLLIMNLIVSNALLTLR